MLRACTIDGFGWFRPVDYRRSWLFFDQVDYILPRDLIGELHIPPQVLESPMYRAVQLALDEEQLLGLTAISASDAARPEFQRLAATQIPPADLNYAWLIAKGDADLVKVAPKQHLDDPLFGLAFLINKLVFYALREGAVPIFGRRYGQQFIREKLAARAAASGAKLGSGPSGPAYAAFSAGLSLQFLPEERLLRLPFEALSDFKSKNRGLLERHQRHLLSVAESFSGLADGPQFEARLAKLREQVESEREALETDARIAWQTLGPDAVRQALVAGSTTLVTGLAVLRGYELHDLFQVGVPAVLAGLGSAAAASVETLSKIRRPQRHVMAYLFAVKRLEDE